MTIHFSREFDKAIGIKKVRTLFSQDTNTCTSFSQLIQETKNGVRAFAQRAQPSYLYKPRPIVG